MLDQWQAPDGWRHRRFRLGAGNRGRLLFLGGRGDMVEKYLEAMAHWAGLGWKVASFDWRGQGGSGRLAADPTVGHVEDFGIWIADLAAFFASWSAEGPGPNVIIGHSMGGHLLLRALAEGAVTPDAVALIAPMFGLNGGPVPGWLGALAARTMAAVGNPARPAWKASEKPLSSVRMRKSLLTHCSDRYADELWWRETTPEIAVGPPSWRWVADAYRSTRALERSCAIERIEVPALILGTHADRLVSPSAITRIAARLPQGLLHMYGDEAAHEILREADGVRDDALRRIDAFLDEKAPAA